MEIIRVLLNKEVYLKRGLETLKLDESFYKLYSSIDSLNKNNNGYSEIFNYLKYMKSYEGKLDASYINSFWEMYTNDGNKFYAIPRELETPFQERISTRYFSSYDEMHELFISLNDFLEEAKPIGKVFIRTSPLENGDASFTKIDQNDKKIVALYSIDGLILAKALYGYPYISYSKYILISTIHLLDGKYEFLDKDFNKYLDKYKISNEIVKQLHQDQGKGRTKTLQ